MVEIKIDLTKEEKVALLEEMRNKVDGHIKWAEFVGADNLMALSNAYQKLLNALK